MTAAEAAKASVYWLMLNTARHSACRSSSEETATAVAWTSTAGAKPQASWMAKVKQMEGKIGDTRRRPSVASGRPSASTARAAISQKVDGAPLRNSGSPLACPARMTAAAATTAPT